MTMLMLALVRTVAVVIPWLLDLAVWALARSLNLPESVVHHTGIFVFAQVQAVENKIGKALCPMRLQRRLQSWFR
jgi:hypothetical protein